MSGGVDVTSADQADLVGRIAAGDVAAKGPERAAEAELCRRFAPRIRLYGLKHLRDEERAGALVQVVLVAVIEALRAGRVDQPEHVDRFVLGTCRNLSLRMRDHERRVTPTSDIDLGSVMPAIETLDIGAMLRCLQALEVRWRTVLHLSFFRDKSADEIADVLAMTPGNVRVVRHRAMAQLRDCMGGAA